MNSNIIWLINPELPNGSCSGCIYERETFPKCVRPEDEEDCVRSSSYGVHFGQYQEVRQESIGMKYEEVTPTWTDAINIHLMCLANPMASDKAKLGAREEILRCAKGLDRARVEIKKLLSDLENLKELKQSKAIGREASTGDDEVIREES